MIDPSWRPPDEFEEYRLIRLLGRGATGDVYLARDALLDRPVAVKFVQAARDPVARARFFNEARAIARLQHANVVAIYRIAEIDRHLYLVSEYVRGRPLDQLDRPAPSRRVLEIALDLARGLAAAHRCGVLHRDVKPANAILADDGRAKLLDFGLASVVDAAEPERPAIAPPRARFDRRAYSQLSAIETTTALAVRSAGSQPAGERDARATPGPDLVAGTPLYMAPEIWCGERATRRSDLYSLGILLYELLAGAAPHAGIPVAALRGIVGRRDIPRIAEAAPGACPALAAIVDRLVESDADARFPSADALVIALEECAAPAARARVPAGNPYRGLSVFESAHAAVFFGRRAEVRELIDRVASESFVIVAGDSGTGKSSLCRAGVLPWFVDHEGWARVDVIPGRHPLEALAAALAAWSDSDEARLVELLRDTPDAVAREIRRRVAPTADRPARRLLVFVDQLEELLTLSAPDEARLAGGALAALAVRVPAVRVLATARSDFLSRLAMLPGLGDEMARGLYFLRPLTGERIREVIVRPAAATGVRFESDALVTALVEQTELAPGGLPLLQFTLAELWDRRDADAGVIRDAALAALGGVAGGLTRHADRVLASLDASARAAARRILLRLVTADGTRARRTAAELVADPADHAALEALVRSRVVAASDAKDGAYEIAHEALVVLWSTLQDWLQDGVADHAVRKRVEQAAAEWQRMARARDLLWGRRQLAATRALDRETLAPHEAAFLATSRAAIARSRLAVAGVAAVLAVAAVGVGLAIRVRARRELAAVLDDQVRAAAAAAADARALAGQRDAVRGRAFELFDTRRWAEGEAAWTEAQALGAREASAYRAASGHLETALSLDPARAPLRARFADLSFERLIRAELDRDGDSIDALAVRVAAYDDGRYRGALDAGARVELEIDPAGTRVWLERPGGERELLGAAPLVPQALATGSATLVFEAPGRLATRLPVLLARGQTVRQRVVLPRDGAAPPGMIYVPAGRFLFGSADSADLRQGFLNAAPLHEVTTGAYYIGRHEVTFGEWIEFLGELAPDERRLRSPSAFKARSSLTLTEIAPRRWRLAITPTTQTYTAETGEPLRYAHRGRRIEQDWAKLPVAAVSYDDAIAFTAWLDRTGRIPRARLCDEYEWERAARGADGRTFPSGSRLAPDDADIDVTYGRDPLAFGPDEVGSHPASRSPVGADDMAGNVWEWTRSVEADGVPVARGGGWYHAELNARATNREPGERTLRTVNTGVRVCATPLDSVSGRPPP